MSGKTAITSVQNLKLSDFYVYSNEDTLVIYKKDGSTYFGFDKNALTLSDIEGNKKAVITNDKLNINNNVIIGHEGKILDFIEWDESTLKIGKDAIIIDKNNQFTFNGIINENNLSTELLEMLRTNKGEPGPPGPPGESGEDGKDGTDTSKYTWIMYAKVNPVDYPNMDGNLTLQPTKDSNYIGSRYNEDDPQDTNSPDNWVESKYTWVKYKGDNAYSVNINGNNIFKLPKNTDGTSASPSKITLVGEPSFTNIDTSYWMVYNQVSKEYEKISGSDNKNTIELLYSNYIEYFKLYNPLDVLYVVHPLDTMNPTPVTDQFSIYTLREGDDANNFILSNQMHTLLTDEYDNVLPNEYDKAYTDVMYFVGTVQKNLKVSDFKTRSFSGRTVINPLEVIVNEEGVTNVRVSVSKLMDSSDIVEIIHIDTSTVLNFSLYKAGDGKVRMVRISGTTAVWKEGSEYTPDVITLNSVGSGGIVFKKWQLKRSDTNGFIDIPNTSSASIKLNTHELFTDDITQIEVKAIYDNKLIGDEYEDTQIISKLDSSYNLILSNTQDKVGLDTYNNYQFEDVYTDITLYQGNVIVPINVIESSMARTFSGGENILLGDIAISTQYPNTSYRIETLSGEDEGKIRLILTNCENGDFITITHVESLQKKIFSISMDEKYIPSVDIVGENIFYIDENGVCKPNYITLQTSSVHIPENETIQWFYWNSDNEWVNVPSNGNSSNYTVYPDSRWLGYNNDMAKFKVKYGSDLANQDTVTVYKLKNGSNAKHLVLSNETQSILTDSNGVIPTSNGEMTQKVFTNIDFFSGTNHIESSISDYDTSVFVDVEGHFEQNENNPYTVKLVITDLTADYGNVGITRIVDGVSYTRTMFVFKSKAGEAGKPGHAGDWVSYIFQKTENRPTAPIGNSGLPPIPNQGVWMDAPTGDGTWWMSKAMISGETNLSISPFSEPIRVSGRDGRDGEGSYILDLSNENASVTCDINGNVIGQMPKCQASLYFGSKLAENVTYSIYPSVDGADINSSTGVLSIISVPYDTTEINIRADVGAFSTTKTMTITKVKPGIDGKDAVIYSLMPSNSVVKIDSNGVKKPNYITCGVNLEVGDKYYPIYDLGDMTDVSSYFNDVKLTYIFDENDTEIDYTIGNSLDLSDASTYVTFKLYKGDVLVDKEDIPLIIDGSEYVYAYQVTASKNTPPDVYDVNWGDTIPTVTKGYYLWMRSGKIVGGNIEYIGVTRISGEDGVSTYSHIKYSNDINGQFIDDSDTVAMANALFMGTLISESPTPSSKPSDYTWARIRGKDGVNGTNGINGTDGADGVNGTNGVSQYFHIKYSINSNGSPMQDTPAKYIGTTVTNSNIAPSDYKSYVWFKLEGNDGTNGINGVNGTDGKSYYLFIRYSNDNGVNFTSNNGTTAGAYMGTYISTVNTASTKPSDYSWVKVKGETGNDGPMPFIKEWNATDTFTRTEKTVDIVLYNTKYFRLKTASSTNQIPPLNKLVWEELETFKMVATDTLLAENANLAEFIFRDGVLISQESYIDGTPNLKLNGRTGEIIANNASIRGDIEATSGKFIGGITISNNAGIWGGEEFQGGTPVFFSGVTSPTDNTFTIEGAAQILEGDMGGYDDANYFIVGKDGTMKCNSVDISGGINIKSLSLKDYYGNSLISAKSPDVSKHNYLPRYTFTDPVVNEYNYTYGVHSLEFYILYDATEQFNTLNLSLPPSIYTFSFKPSNTIISFNDASIGNKVLFEFIMYQEDIDTKTLNSIKRQITVNQWNQHVRNNTRPSFEYNLVNNIKGIVNTYLAFVMKVPVGVTFETQEQNDCGLHEMMLAQYRYTEYYENTGSDDFYPTYPLFSCGPHRDINEKPFKILNNGELKTMWINSNIYDYNPVRITDISTTTNRATIDITNINYLIIDIPNNRPTGTISLNLFSNTQRMNNFKILNISKNPGHIIKITSGAYHFEFYNNTDNMDMRSHSLQLIKDRLYSFDIVRHQYMVYAHYEKSSYMNFVY